MATAKNIPRIPPMEVDTINGIIFIFIKIYLINNL